MLRKELVGLGIEPNAELLLATVTGEGESRLYVFNERGIVEPRNDNPGYALLGRGLVTGGLLLLRLLDYTGGDWDLGMLSAFIIDIVSETDPTVSPFLGESFFIRFEGGRVVLGPLKEEAFKEYKKRVRLRREAFKLLWNVMEVSGEEGVLEVVRELK